MFQLNKEDILPEKNVIKPRAISGFPDYSEAQNVALSDWLRRIENTYRAYGFSRLIPRPLELRSVLLSRGGIQKQVFGVSRLPDDSVTDLALPFDRTVPLANWVAKNASDIAFPYKRYDISYSFRGERAQAGRFQGFFQADIDIIGYEDLDLNADAECIAVIYEALVLLNIGDFVVSLNHIGLARAILYELGLDSNLTKQALTVIDKIQKTGPDAAATELRDELNLSSQVSKKIADLFSFSGDVSSFAASTSIRSSRIDDGLEELAAIWSALISLGIPADRLSFWPRNVRGLDYYSGVVFETFLKDNENVGSVASGGRYEDLVSTFSPLNLPGAGGSIGVTRLFDTACKNNLIGLTRKSESEVFVGFRTPELRTCSHQLASLLRKRGFRVDLFSGVGKFKKQMAYADRKGIRLLVVPMEADSILVRDMKTGVQLDKPTVAETLEYVDSFLIDKHPGS